MEPSQLTTKPEDSLLELALEGWPLADCVHRLRRLMEAQMGNPGRREFVQVLRMEAQAIKQKASNRAFI
jgi:hypothetical protein